MCHCGDHFILQTVFHSYQSCLWVCFLFKFFIFICQRFFEQNKNNRPGNKIPVKNSFSKRNLFRFLMRYKVGLIKSHFNLHPHVYWKLIFLWLLSFYHNRHSLCICICSVLGNQPILNFFFFIYRNPDFVFLSYAFDVSVNYTSILCF